jgi:uncharacterized membrane protein
MRNYELISIKINVVETCSSAGYAQNVSSVGVRSAVALCPNPATVRKVNMIMQRTTLSFHYIYWLT